MMRTQEHGLLLYWLLGTCLALFGFIVCVDQGLLQALIETDRSGISFILLALYLVGLGHSLLQTVYISRELNITRSIEKILTEHHTALGGDSLTAASQSLPACFISSYLKDLGSALAAPLAKDRDPTPHILDAYALRLRRPQEFGWFLIDAMLKVGFLGTLIGFILMLGSISGSQNLDASMLQQVLQKMSYGMSTALNTTLVSLVGAIFLSIPYYFLDRALEELLETAVRISEVHILPALPAAG